MDKIIKVEEIPHTVNLNLKSGKKVETKAITKNTYYESGRKDCEVLIQKPLGLFSNEINPKEK